MGGFGGGNTGGNTAPWGSTGTWIVRTSRFPSSSAEQPATVTLPAGWVSEKVNVVPLILPSTRPSRPVHPLPIAWPLPVTSSPCWLSCQTSCTLSLVPTHVPAMFWGTPGTRASATGIARDIRACVGATRALHQDRHQGHGGEDTPPEDATHSDLLPPVVDASIAPIARCTSGRSEAGLPESQGWFRVFIRFFSARARDRDRTACVTRMGHVESRSAELFDAVLLRPFRPGLRRTRALA